MPKAVKYLKIKCCIKYCRDSADWERNEKNFCEKHYEELFNRLIQDICDMKDYHTFWRCDCGRLAPDGYQCIYCGLDPSERNSKTS